MNSPEFKEMQKDDPELRELARKAKTQTHKTRGRFFFRQGVLMKKLPRQDNMEMDVVVLPTSLRKPTMQHFHGTMPGTHTGNKRTLATIQLAYYWPHMISDYKSIPLPKAVLSACTTNHTLLRSRQHIRPGPQRNQTIWSL